MTNAFASEIIGLEREVWTAMSTSTASSKFTRHDASKIGAQRASVYYRDDAVVLLPYLPMCDSKDKIHKLWEGQKPLEHFSMDESSIRVRAVTGKEGDERAAVITYKASQGTAGGATESMETGVWARREGGDWLVVAHLCCLASDTTGQQIQDIYFNSVKNEEGNAAKADTFASSLLGLEQEVWAALSTSTASTKYTRHDASKVDTRRSAAYFREDLVMMLPTFPFMNSREEAMKLCAQQKPYTSLELDQSSLRVRVLSGEAGAERAATISYKVTHSSGEGSMQTERLSTWAREEGKDWYVVSHAANLVSNVSGKQIRDIHFNSSVESR